MPEKRKKKSNHILLLWAQNNWPEGEHHGCCLCSEVVLLSPPLGLNGVQDRFPLGLVALADLLHLLFHLRLKGSQPLSQLCRSPSADLQGETQRALHWRNTAMLLEDTLATPKNAKIQLCSQVCDPISLVTTKDAKNNHKVNCYVFSRG